MQRTYLTARSTEFDAVIVAATAAPAPDAEPGLDAKAAAPGGPLDPRAALLLTEAFRHAKAIAILGAGEAALNAAHIPQDAAGIVFGEDAEALVTEVSGLLAAHRVWEWSGLGNIAFAAVLTRGPEAVFRVCWPFPGKHHRGPAGG